MTEVQAVLDRLVGSGAERGLQVSVYRRGEQVIDALAGWPTCRAARITGPPPRRARARAGATTRSSGPMTAPVDESRSTIDCMPSSGAPDATGRSELPGTRSPARRKLACR
jgi:hypothetical protein